MNERIQELAEQAELYAVSDNSSMLFDVWKKRYNEKFAELIVREAAQFVSGSAEVYTQAEQDACARAAIGLKKYFGVKE